MEGVGMPGKGEGKEEEEGRKVRTPPLSIPAYVPGTIHISLSNAGTCLKRTFFSVTSEPISINQTLLKTTVDSMTFFHRQFGSVT